MPDGPKVARAEMADAAFAARAESLRDAPATALLSALLVGAYEVEASAEVEAGSEAEIQAGTQA